MTDDCNERAYIVITYLEHKRKKKVRWIIIDERNNTGARVK